METLNIQPELSGLSDIIWRPHNDAAKVYSYFGRTTDPRFGDGCLHQSFDVMYRIPGSRVLWDPEQLHFAVQLEDGTYFDPAWNQITLPKRGVAKTLEEGCTIEVKQGDGYFSSRIVYKGNKGRPYTMYPYTGSFDDALGMLMKNPLLGNRFALTWYEDGEMRRIIYYPYDDALYFENLDEPDWNEEWINRVASHCNASPEELHDYFRNASLLLHQSRTY